MNKKFTSRILSMLLAMLMLVSMLPTSVFAAPASDIPAEMLDNVFLDALEYTGYKAQNQKDDGTIFKKYSSGATAYLSKISYGLNKYGTETVAKSGTATGLAPDIAGFESNGLCCASFVSYVYYNYLPNIRALTPAAQPVHTIYAPQRHTCSLRTIHFCSSLSMCFFLFENVCIGFIGKQHGKAFFVIAQAFG